MSTPKKDATKKVAAVAKDGNIVGHRAITADKDGNVREATPEEMAQAKNAFITVASKTDKGIEIANTYDCFIQHYDNGNIGLFIRTSNKLDDVEVDNPHPTQLGDGVGVLMDPDSYELVDFYETEEYKQFCELFEPAV